jgi:two-component system, response regulator, stage 0 sporulation protein F
MLKPIKMLVVDDQAGIRFLLREVFERQNYEVFEAVNATDAIEKANKITPNVVLSDIGLGGKDKLDGCDAIMSIKSKKPDTVAIVISGDYNYEKIKKVKQCGADSYIEKPFEVDNLIAMVNEELTKYNDK